MDQNQNFTQFNNNLSTSGALTQASLGFFKHNHYAYVINLLPDQHALAWLDEHKQLELYGIEYIYIPVNFKNPLQADLNQFYSALARCSNQKVHIHCAANYRVSVFYGLYAFKNNILNIQDAQAVMRHYWDPFANPVWRQFIEFNL